MNHDKYAPVSSQSPSHRAIEEKAPHVLRIERGGIVVEQRYWTRRAFELAQAWEEQRETIAQFTN